MCFAASNLLLLTGPVARCIDSWKVTLHGQKNDRMIVSKSIGERIEHIIVCRRERWAILSYSKVKALLTDAGLFNVKNECELMKH